MKRIGLGIAAVVAVAVAFLAPAVASAGSDQSNVHATLLRIDVFNPAKGAPQPLSANCSPDGPTAANETALTGWKTAGGTAHLNTSTLPDTVPTAAAALQSAFSAWSTGTHAPAFTLATDGTATRPTPNRQTDVMFGRVSGSAIAVTYTWRWADGLVESDTVFNRALGWKDLPDNPNGCDLNAPYYDLQDIATHEFGHIYGLDHPATGRYETMWAYGYTGETLKRTPGLGDLTGIATLY